MYSSRSRATSDGVDKRAKEATVQLTIGVSKIKKGWDLRLQRRDKGREHRQNVECNKE